MDDNATLHDGIAMMIDRASDMHLPTGGAQRQGQAKTVRDEVPILCHQEKDPSRARERWNFDRLHGPGKSARTNSNGFRHDEVVGQES